MFSGLLTRYVNLDFLSTHHIINRIAYDHIFSRGRFFRKRLARKREQFPSLESIQNFSGYEGPDGGWLRGETKESEHTFNPVSEQGHALEAVSTQYQELVQSLRNGDARGSARNAAYLSHYVVDALDPAHHIGQHSAKHPVYNWEDPYLLSGAPFLYNFPKRHMWFEFRSACFLYWQQKRYALRRFHIPRRRTDVAHILRAFKRRVRHVHRLNIYEKFFHKDLHVTAKQHILRVMFPMMITSVSHFWLSALFQTRRLRRRSNSNISLL
ncbi:MAG: hypothetical protein A3F54_04340 [Candidatus Kerfeldbacteria bacterium RIFCSPHIGHO2_12_FULL_48_17]|uniref:Phospholipase C/D domain-containing protein n=1 Tax=Candidatus Kerfeldbacteria bacterium RIFCSPHIGHO2_12_FULL_48_17 TaxID=1798542 RepID=A0A1G2BA94_9BACT|nr:MAG: hypothetical protein A3F54_04340 [Candidatus Kerfeldbacteria bacterium RIFCSPHIGHO2_12_FULL_48_17]